MVFLIIYTYIYGNKTNKEFGGCTSILIVHPVHSNVQSNLVVGLKEMGSGGRWSFKKGVIHLRFSFETMIKTIQCSPIEVNRFFFGQMH